MADPTGSIAMRLVANTKPSPPRRTSDKPYVPTGGVIRRTPVPAPPPRKTVYVLPEGAPIPKPRGKVVISAKGVKFYDDRPQWSIGSVHTPERAVAAKTDIGENSTYR